MKRRFTILTAALALLAFLALPMGMMGQTRDVETFTFSELGYGNAEDVTTVVGDDVTLTFDAGSNANNSPKYYNTGSGVRMYTGNTLEVALNDQTGDTRITAIDFTFSGTTYSGGLQNWTGSETSHTFTATSNARIQVIAVTFSEGGTAPTTYTVTYYANVTGTAPVVDTYVEGADVTLRDANTFTNDGYTFSEWNTDADGDGDAYEAGEVIEGIDDDIELYAIWTENPVSDDHWVLTELADLTSSDVFVIVGNNGSNYAMSNDKGTSASPTAVAVTVTGNEITSTVAANIQWNISGDATNGYTFYPNGSTTTWLYCTNSNTGVRVGTNAAKTFVVDGGYLKNNGTSRYLGVYNSSDWRCYTSIGSNIANQTFAFYKKVTGSLPPSIIANDVEIAYDATSGEIAYTLIQNGNAGTLSVSDNVDWITNVLPSLSLDKVTFNTTVNEATTPREGIITITYTYGDNETVSKDVTVTQAAAPVIYTTIPALFVAATNAGNTATDVIVTFGNWVVTGANNSSHAFVSDGTNGFMIYGTGHGFSAGDVLSGTVECKVQLYNGAIEITQLTSTTSGLTVTTGGTVTVANIPMADLAGINTGALVSYQNLTCEERVEGNYTNYYLSDGTTEIQAYKTLLNNYADYLEDGKTYNITGVFVLNNSTKRINPRSAEDIEEVEVQHEEYTLTVSNLSHVNLFIFGGEDSETIISTEDGETTAQVYDGTEVLVSIDVEAGYVFQSLTITDGNGNAVETEELTPDEYYSFTMPTSNVTISATAVEYVAPVGGNYVRITSLDQLTEGSKVIIAARYNESVTNGYYAMKTALTSGKAAGVNFTSTTSDGNEILPTSIVNEEDDYYWIVNETENGYTFTNANDAKISYNNSTNFIMNGSSADWTIESGTAGNSAMVAGYTGFVIKNYATNTRAFAFNGSVFGPYSWTNNNAAGYNFFLDFFVQTSAPVTETFTKHIDAYDVENERGWYLIASPLAEETVPTDVANLIPANAGNYALYRFNQDAELEWENYKAHTNDFMLEPGRGYLYANSTEGGVDLTFIGTPYSGNGEVTLHKTAGAEFEGMNLVGNPFAVSAFADRPYYAINETGTGIMTETSTSVVGAMEGIFVEAENDGDIVTFTPEEPAGDKGLVLNLSQGRGVVDRAIVYFGEGHKLHKFTLNENSTKMYIPQEGEDFAVVRSRNSGEVTVNFEPAEDGIYSISVDAENLIVRSLILTDKVERVDIDLLRTPSYQFKAATTDPADRFVLSYKTGTNQFKELFMAAEKSADFGNFNNGSWMIDNEGEATLQVIDVNGRVLSSETINGNASIHVDVAPGVYMFRLINGDSVKVQKVVVE